MIVSERHETLTHCLANVGSLVSAGKYSYLVGGALTLLEHEYESIYLVGHFTVLTLVLLNCLKFIFRHLKLELLTQFPASNDVKKNIF